MRRTIFFLSRIKLLFALAVLIILCACSNTIVVTIPPRVDLSEFKTIGVVQFASEGPLSLEQEATHRFLATMQASQPGIRLLELGTEKEVLNAVGASGLDLVAIKKIGSHFGVDAVLTGLMSVSEIKPDISIGQSLTSLSAQAAVNASLKGKIRETTTGATVWTNGAHGKWNIASLCLNGNGLPTSLGLTDPGQKYEQMLDDLVRLSTADFRPTYERRKVEN